MNKEYKIIQLPPQSEEEIQAIRDKYMPYRNMGDRKVKYLRNKKLSYSDESNGSNGIVSNE